MPKTVLLADDNVTIRRVVELTFADEDVTIVAAADGERAIELIGQDAPDLVLADIAMPGRTGYEIAEFVRSQPRLASLPVLLLAGAFEPVDHAQAHRVGADGILTKPFDPAVLVARVNELLTAGRGEPSAVESRPPSTRPTSILHRVSSVPATAPSGGATAGSSEPELPAIPATAPPDSGDAQAAAVQPSPVSETDRYFDEVDQAFAALSKSPRPPVAPAEHDHQAGEAEQVPASAPDVPAAPSTGTAAIPLTDAFAALLDAEREGKPAAALRAALNPVAPAPPPVDVNALADQIARKVLEQLSDRVVRETVAQIVGDVAERLVREEIERIKRNIK